MYICVCFIRNVSNIQQFVVSKAGMVSILILAVMKDNAVTEVNK